MDVQHVHKLGTLCLATAPLPEGSGLGLLSSILFFSIFFLFAGLKYYNPSGKKIKKKKKKKNHMLRQTKQVAALPPPSSPAAGCSECFRSSPLTLGNTAEISFTVKSARIMVAQHLF